MITYLVEQQVIWQLHSVIVPLFSTAAPKKKSPPKRSPPKEVEEKVEPEAVPKAKKSPPKDVSISEVKHEPANQFLYIIFYLIFTFKCFILKTKEENEKTPEKKPKKNNGPEFVEVYQDVVSLSSFYLVDFTHYNRVHWHTVSNICY